MAYVISRTYVDAQLAVMGIKPDEWAMASLDSKAGLLAAVAQAMAAAAISNQKPADVTIVRVDSADMSLPEAMWTIAQSITQHGGNVTITPQGWFTQLPPLAPVPG